MSAAHLERSIEKELIERLKSKAYGDGPLNVNETVWQAILDREHNGSVVGQREDENLDLVADETDEEIIENEMEDEWDDREFVSDISGDDLSDLEGPLVCVQLFIMGFIPFVTFTNYRTMIPTEMMRVSTKTVGNRRPTNGNHPMENGRPHLLKVCQFRGLERDLKVRTRCLSMRCVLTTYFSVETPRVEVVYEEETENVSISKAPLTVW